MNRRQFLTGGLACAGAAAGVALGTDVGEPDELTLRWVEVGSDEYQHNQEAIRAWATRAEVATTLGHHSIRAAQVRSDQAVVAVQVFVRDRGGSIQVDRSGAEPVAATRIVEFEPGVLPDWPVDGWPD